MYNTFDMNPLRFVVKPHDILPGCQIVEVFRGSKFIGAIGGGNKQDTLTFQSPEIDTDAPVRIEPFTSFSGEVFQARIPLKG